MERACIDDSLVIDDWRRHGRRRILTPSIWTPEKAYKIRLEYFKVGTATARLGIGTGEQRVTDAISTAAKADAVVLCMGFDPSLGRSVCRTFRLPSG
jgi:hypothetical protein